jgi:hypothetical protein
VVCGFDDLALSQASRRSSHVVSLFLVRALVSFGGRDRDTASFCGHYPDADSEADADAFPETATWSMAVLGGGWLAGT